MKKTHWLRNTVIVLVICGLIGTVLAGVLFFSEGTRTYATASVQFSFEGAADGTAPNGYPFDVSGFTSDEVLDTALEASGLTGVYTAEQLRENLTVMSVYPEGITEKMTKYTSLLDTDEESLAAITDYHATQYSVKLYNDFDKSISSGKLQELLGNIMAAYRAYFAKTYAVRLEQENPIENLPDYDYAQQMSAISDSVNQQSRYAEKMTELGKDFRTDGKSFGDIVMMYRSLQSDVDRLNATITLNAVSKDRQRLEKRYETEIRELQFQLDSLTEEKKQLDAQVDAFSKDGIIYVSANGELNQIGGKDDETYDKLVQMRQAVTDRIAQTNAKIVLYQTRLDDMTGPAEAKESAGGDEDAAAAGRQDRQDHEALKTTVEAGIQSLVEKKNAVAGEFAAMLDAYSKQEINERTVSVTGTKYETPKLLSGAFVMKVIRTAGPFCAIGFMVCMVLLIISRKKEEKA